MRQKEWDWPWCVCVCVCQGGRDAMNKLNLLLGTHLDEVGEWPLCTLLKAESELGKEAEQKSGGALPLCGLYPQCPPSAWASLLGPLSLAIFVLTIWRWPEGSQCAGLLYNPIIGCNLCMKYVRICLPINSCLKNNHISTYRPLGQVLHTCL